MRTPEEQAKANALATRAYRYALLCQEMIAIDPLESPLAHETLELSNLMGHIKEAVAAGKMQFSTCLRLADLIFDIREECIAERKVQLQKAGTN